MNWHRVFVRYNDRWEGTSYVDGEEQVVVIPSNRLARDNLLADIYEFMEESPTHVKYTLHYLTKGVDGRLIKGLLQNDVHLSYLVHEELEPIVYVSKIIIQETIPIRESNDVNEGVGNELSNEVPNGDEDFERELSDADENNEREVQRNQVEEFCEWICEPGRNDELLNLLQRGHDLSSEQVAPNFQAPNVEGSMGGHWMIPVAHVDDEVIEDDLLPLDNDILAKGMIFMKKKDLVHAVGDWHMQNHLEYYVSRSTKTRYEVICKNLECSFRLAASAKDEGRLWKLKTFENNHTCQLDLTRNAPRKVSYNIIAKYFSKRLRHVHARAVLNPKDMIAELLDNFGLKIQYNLALRARNLAMEMVYGDHDESFQKLPAYLYVLKKKNPDTMYDLKTTADDRFKFMFVALGVSRAAFGLCMRPVIVIDGTHLKGKNKGILFVAVTQDGNQQVFPLAIGVGPIENNESWIWFLERLKRAFGDRENLVIVSDQHPSIKAAVRLVYPNAFHALCFHHVKKNLSKHSDLAETFRLAAYAYSSDKFEKYFSMIASRSTTAYNTLKSIGAKRWARSQCPVHRFNFMTSNAAESFNSTVLWPRRLPICSLIEYIRSIIEKWFDNRRALAMSSKQMLTKVVLHKINQHAKKGSHYEVQNTQAYLYKVRCDDRRFEVDLNHKTCDCGEFQLEQIPCDHAAAAIRASGLNIYDFVEHYYKQHTLVLAYHDRVNSMPHDDEMVVPNDVSSFKVLPPIAVSQAGRPRIKRYKSSSEGSGSRRKKSCSRCGSTTHNMSTCNAPLAFESSEKAQGKRQPKRCSICHDPGHTKRRCLKRFDETQVSK